MLEWASSVRALAEPVRSHHIPDSGDHEASEAFVAGFRDERGQRRPSDPVFLRHALRLGAPAEPAPDFAAGLWGRVASGAAASDGFGVPLFPELSREGIERWTEEELSGLHAIAWLSLRERPESALERLAPVARFHVEELQPDNATQRPWAAHVFRLLFETTGEVAFRLHADTLVHACVVRTGVPDVFSAWVLHDAADAAEAFVGALHGRIA